MLVTIETRQAESNKKENVNPTVLEKLNIVVHPSYITENLDLQPFGNDAKTFYAGQTKMLQERIVKEFIPKSVAEAVIIMPHEKPSLASWRRQKKAREKDEVMWMDLYKQLKAGTTDFSDNVRVINDVSHLNSDIEYEKEKEYVEAEIERWKSLGFDINDQTEIILGGESRDVCITVVARRLLLSEKIKKVKISKKATMFLNYFPDKYPTVDAFSEYENRENSGLISGINATQLIKDGSPQYQAHEDDNYIYVEKLEK